MQFHEYETGYVYAKKNHLPFFNPDPVQFYKDCLPLAVDGASQGFSINANIRHLRAEAAWYECGRPYYKVWPGMVDTFISTRMDVNSEHLRSPYTTFIICLPTDPVMLDFEYEGERYWVRTVTVYCPAEFDFGDERHFYLWVDYGEVYEGMITRTYRHAVLKKGNTIEDGFKALPLAPSSKVGVQMPESIFDACTRLAVAVCFLASGASRVLEKDILQRHLDQYRKEPEGSDNRKRWEEKSVRYGLTGWHIGRDKTGRALSLNRGMTYAEAIESGDHKQLMWQHERGGHFHIVRCGTGRKETRIAWYDQVTVRPDLPPKPL